MFSNVANHQARDPADADVLEEKLKKRVGWLNHNGFDNQLSYSKVSYYILLS